jgi:hypothetical protein
MDELDPERVAYAAALGHPAALEVIEPAVLPTTQRKRVERGAKLLGRVGSVRWACDLADHALDHAWTDKSDTRPAEAIAAARVRAGCPRTDHTGTSAVWSAPCAALAARAPWAAARSALASAQSSSVYQPEEVRVVQVAAAAWEAVLSGAITWDEVLADLAERLLA